MVVGEQTGQCGRVRFRLATVAAAWSLSMTACSDEADERLARCRELEPDRSAAQAWDDIAALHETTAAFLALECERVLAEAEAER